MPEVTSPNGTMFRVICLDGYYASEDTGIMNCDDKSHWLNAPQCLGKFLSFFDYYCDQLHFLHDNNNNSYFEKAFRSQKVLSMGQLWINCCFNLNTNQGINCPEIDHEKHFLVPKYIFKI